jgi:hypothetical protein
VVQRFSQSLSLFPSSLFVSLQKFLNPDLTLENCIQFHNGYFQNHQSFQIPESLLPKMSSSSHIGQRAQDMANNQPANKSRIPQGKSPTESEEIVSPGVGSPKFNDSGFFENEEDNIPQTEYRDFILFDNVGLTQDALNLFADVDASIVANQGSVHNESNNGATVQIEQVTSNAAQQSPTRFYDTVRESVSINEAVFSALSNNYDDPSQPTPLKCPPTPYLRPLELWENTFERHESIAYRFEQPPHLV